MARRNTLVYKEESLFLKGPGLNLNCDLKKKIQLRSTNDIVGGVASRKVFGHDGNTNLPATDRQNAIAAACFGQ